MKEIQGDTKTDYSDPYITKDIESVCWVPLSKFAATLQSPTHKCTAPCVQYKGPTILIKVLGKVS